MNQIRILLKILLLQATAIIQVIRLSNYGNFRTIGALSSPGLPTSLTKIKKIANCAENAMTLGTNNFKTSTLTRHDTFHMLFRGS